MAVADLGAVKPLAKVLFDNAPESGSAKLKVKLSVKRKAAKVKKAKESRS